MLDPPEKAIPLPTELPGHKFGLHRQCQQAFGDKYTQCPNAPEDQACAQLWCQEEGKIQCTTRNGSLPWADGTPCGEDRRCREGLCVSSALEEAGEEKVCTARMCMCVIRFYHTSPVSTYASKVKKNDWKHLCTDLRAPLLKISDCLGDALLMGPCASPYSPLKTVNICTYCPNFLFCLSQIIERDYQR